MPIKNSGISPWVFPRPLFGRGRVLADRHEALLPLFCPCTSAVFEFACRDSQDRWKYGIPTDPFQPIFSTFYVALLSLVSGSCFSVRWLWVSEILLLTNQSTQPGHLLAHLSFLDCMRPFPPLNSKSSRNDTVRIYPNDAPSLFSYLLYDPALDPTLFRSPRCDLIYFSRGYERTASYE